MSAAFRSTQLVDLWHAALTDPCLSASGEPRRTVTASAGSDELFEISWQDSNGAQDANMRKLSTFTELVDGGAGYAELARYRRH
jgi:hypothetical protein